MVNLIKSWKINQWNFRVAELNTSRFIFGYVIHSNLRYFQFLTRWLFWNIFLFCIFYFYFLSALCSFFNVRQSLFIARKKLSWQIRRNINIISLQGDYYWTTERAARLHIVLHTPQPPLHCHIFTIYRSRSQYIAYFLLVNWNKSCIWIKLKEFNHKAVQIMRWFLKYQITITSPPVTECAGKIYSYELFMHWNEMLRGYAMQCVYETCFKFLTWLYTNYKVTWLTSLIFRLHNWIMIYMFKMAAICVIIMKFLWIYLSSVTDFHWQPTL